MNTITGTNLKEINGYQEILKKSPSQTEESQKSGFESLFQSALDLLNETNSLSNRAEEEEIKYAMGMSDSIHDLQAAQQKANISLQYTVAVRNNVYDAYREIMNMQI